NFIGLTRGDASALAERSGLEPVFDGATGEGARVRGQSPGFGTLILQTGIAVRLQMEAKEPPQLRVPNFIGLTPSDARALAEQSGLGPVFRGAPSRKARVGSQSPRFGTLIDPAGNLVRLQMEAPPTSVPPAPTTALPAPTTAPPAPTTAPPAPTTAP